MGLGHSKAHPRVIKVTPLQSQETETPSTGPVFFALNRNLEEESSFTRLQDQNRTREGQLPPLRETWYGRLPAGMAKPNIRVACLGLGRAVVHLHDYLHDLQKSRILKYRRIFFSENWMFVRWMSSVTFDCLYQLWIKYFYIRREHHPVSLESVLISMFMPTSLCSHKECWQLQRPQKLQSHWCAKWWQLCSSWILNLSHCLQGDLMHQAL